MSLRMAFMRRIWGKIIHRLKILLLREEFSWKDVVHLLPETEDCWHYTAAVWWPHTPTVLGPEVVESGCCEFLEDGGKWWEYLWILGGIWYHLLKCQECRRSLPSACCHVRMSLIQTSTFLHYSEWYSHWSCFSYQKCVSCGRPVSSNFCSR